MQSEYSNDAFRDAAKRLYPKTYMDQYADVQRPQSGGAFVSVFVWVSDEEAKKSQVSLDAKAKREIDERIARFDADRKATEAREAQRG